MTVTLSGPSGIPGTSDYRNGVKKIPESAFIKFEDLSPEQQAEWKRSDARVAEADRIAAWMEKESKVVSNEVWYRGAPNVNSLTREQALYQIEYMGDLIQSGEADKIPLSAAKGTQATSNYRQYVYWVQQHMKELDAAGQSTLAQV